MHCKNLFWIENLKELFCDFRIIPIKGSMSREAIYNSLTRLVLLIFLVLLLFFDLTICIAFLVISVSALIIFYYTKKNRMKENFDASTILPTKINTWLNNRPSTYVWCNDNVDFPSENPNFVSVIPNKVNDTGKYMTVAENQADNTPVSNYQSMNQRLAGGANPKTLIPPVIVPPIADLDYWKTNNLVTHSHVNDMKQIDDYQSGYQVSTCCGADQTPMRMIDSNPALYSSYRTLRSSSGGYKQNNYRSNMSNDVSDYIEPSTRYQKKEFGVRENFKLRGPEALGEEEHAIKLPEAIRDEYVVLPQEIKANQSGQVNVSCGYNPSQLYTANLPTNFPSSKCERSPYMDEYNDNLFTQTIQPGVYSKNQVNEPINGNMGISFTQQLEPLTISTNGEDVTFTRHDPRIMGELIEEPEIETVNAANVYDPRFSGYGTSYRAYENELLGRTDFYYDDIDAVRMPNYITRNKIDFMKSADSYGPMKTEYGNPNNEVIRNLANNQFMSSALEFRTGMQESLMRKNNAEGWQKRKMPLNLHMR